MGTGNFRTPLAGGGVFLEAMGILSGAVSCQIAGHFVLPDAVLEEAAPARSAAVRVCWDGSWACSFWPR